LLIGVRNLAFGQCLRRGNVPDEVATTALQFAAISPLQRNWACARASSRAAMPEPGNGLKPTHESRSFNSAFGAALMTVTAAHIPAIVALIAGVLILVMPRLLNLVVAIYLICIGLIGLGVLKMFHL
jgi:hypothetical protein